MLDIVVDEVDAEVEVVGMTSFERRKCGARGSGARSMKTTLFRSLHTSEHRTVMHFGPNFPIDYMLA